MTSVHGISDITDRSGFPGGSEVKNLPANAGHTGSVSGSGRSPGEGNGNSFQYSCLENPMDRRVWQAVVHGIARVEHNIVTKPLPPHIQSLYS